MSKPLPCPDRYHAFHGGNLFPGTYECQEQDPTISREARILMDADGDPQETIDLLGDDGVIDRVVVPRVWHMPTRPATGVKLRDRDGKVWSRREGDPEWVDLWYAGGMNALHWHKLLGTRGPLTEVL